MTKIIHITENGDLVSVESEERTKITKSKVMTTPEVIVPIHYFANHQF